MHSITEHSNNNVEIILINDTSDDGFDYQSVADRYNVNYIVNPKRLGVAASRDLGVNLCRTPYFLLLDAHMRFYDNLWVQKIVDALAADQRRLLCCRTKTLNLKNGLLTEACGKQSSFGGCIDFNRWQRFCEPDFTFNKIADATLPEASIVCVLGAGYACSKKYWQYLKGLEGLIFYGNDEAYISIKVWLEGGSCQLLKEVVIGHIYRSGRPPYSIDGTPRLYNRLFISELFLPPKLKKELSSQIRLFQCKILPEALLILHSSRDKIIQLKEYYQEIFTRDFSFFEELNRKVYKQNIMVDNISDILSAIAARAEQEPMPDIGLLKGRMGLAIFLFHYAQLTGQERHTALAEKMLEELLKDIKPDAHYGFATGLSGVGWGIQYLHRRGFVEGDASEILEDFDRKIMEVNPMRAFSLNRYYGFGGIVQYLVVSQIR